MPTDGAAASPRPRLPFLVVDGELVPAWSSDRDRPWLRDLLAEAEAAAGRPFGEVAAAWRRAPPDPRAGPRGPLARRVLLGWLGAPRPCRRTHSAVRRALFAAAAAGTPRDAALAAVAAAHGTTPDALLAGLFADLPGERCIRWPSPPPDPSRLLLATNTRLVQGLLRHAHRASLRLRGASRAVLRTAWLHGAGLAIAAVDAEGAHLAWTPPRPGATAALRALVPLLPWARSFDLRADCRIGRHRGVLRVATGDPLLPGPEPRRFDSALEATFAREFGRLAPEWELLREPTPVPLAHGFAFPDFELLHRRSGERWHLELAGLRDGRALPAKLALLQQPRCLLCLPAAAVPAPFAGHPRLIPFRRRVDPAAVLAALPHPP